MQPSLKSHCPPSCPLIQWFLTVVILASREHWVMPGDIYHGHCWDFLPNTGIWWREFRDAALHPSGHRKAPHNKETPVGLRLRNPALMSSSAFKFSISWTQEKQKLWLPPFTTSFPGIMPHLNKECSVKMTDVKSKCSGPRTSRLWRWAPGVRQSADEGRQHESLSSYLHFILRERVKLDISKPSYAVSDLGGN